VGDVGKPYHLCAFVKPKTRLGHIVQKIYTTLFFILTLSKVPSQTINMKMMSLKLGHLYSIEIRSRKVLLKLNSSEHREVGATEIILSKLVSY